MTTSGRKASLVGSYADGIFRLAVWAVEVAAPAVVTAFVLKSVFEPKPVETTVKQR